MDEGIAAQIETIEHTMVRESAFGFDPSILGILDNVDVGQREIESLKSRLGPSVCTFLFNIANSAYHGSLKMGGVQQFYDVVNRLGLQYTKAFIIQFVLHHLARECHEAEIIFAKNFASSVIGRIMTRGFGFADDEARKVELACLLSGIGLLMMTAYRHHHPAGPLVLSDDFIERHHADLTDRIIRRFQIPDEIREMLLFQSFTLNRMELALPSVVILAIAAVDWSFRTMNNRLVVRSSFTSLEDRLTPSLAGIIEDKFAAAGLQQYLIVLPQASPATKDMH